MSVQSFSRSSDAWLGQSYPVGQRTSIRDWQTVRKNQMLSEQTVNGSCTEDLLVCVKLTESGCVSVALVFRDLRHMCGNYRSIHSLISLRTHLSMIIMLWKKLTLTTVVHRRNEQTISMSSPALKVSSYSDSYWRYWFQDWECAGDITVKTCVGWNVVYWSNGPY